MRRFPLLDNHGHIFKLNRFRQKTKRLPLAEIFNPGSFKRRLPPAIHMKNPVCTARLRMIHRTYINKVCSLPQNTAAEAGVRIRLVLPLLEHKGRRHLTAAAPSDAAIQISAVLFCPVFQHLTVLRRLFYHNCIMCSSIFIVIIVPFHAIGNGPKVTAHLVAESGKADTQPVIVIMLAAEGTVLDKQKSLLPAAQDGNAASSGVMVVHLWEPLLVRQLLCAEEKGVSAVPRTVLIPDMQQIKNFRVPVIGISKFKRQVRMKFLAKTPGIIECRYGIVIQQKYPGLFQHPQIL